MSDNTVTNLTVHSYDWKTKDSDDGKTLILCWALNRDSKPHLLRFHDFPAYCHIELPLFIGHKRISWTASKAQQVFDTICYMLGEDKPFKFFFKQAEKLYYYRAGKKYPMMVVLFNTIRSMYNCKNKLNQPFNVKDLGMIACKVWETNIPIVRKLLTLRNVKYCQWFEIQGVKVMSEDKISTLEEEYVVDRFTMNPIPPEETGSWVTSPRVLSFDIETFSDRHRALPDPYSSKHVCYMISCEFQQLDKPETRKKELILFGDCNPTKKGNVTKVKSETELIDTLSDFVVKYDPDVVIGYNIFGYDNPYLDTRLKRRLREWKPMGRLLNEPTKMSSFSWGSSGYGHNEINILEMDGRIMIDLLPLIRRDYKLSLYNLGFVSTYFLGRTKHPITAREMFETYELSKDSEITPQVLLSDYVKDKLKLIRSDPDVNTTDDVFKKFHVMQYMPKDMHGVKHPKISDIPVITLKEHAMEEMKKVVEYCIVDSELVLDIFQKISCWISLVETANVMGVTMVELFTRGQQLRIQSQVYDEASKDGIVLDERIVPRMEYAGGLVQDPEPGLYHNIPCYDFKSLYPSVMIAHNIDYRTFVPPEMMDKVPDEMCHVIEWDEVPEGKDDKAENDDSDDETPEVSKEVKTVHYKYKFVKQDHLLGILPRMLVKLISERDAVRELQKKYKKNGLEWTILERKQLALKVSANSAYGSLGAQMGGKLPLPEGAACVTAKSRESISVVNAELNKKGKVVYGDTDSSMPDLAITDSANAYKIAYGLSKELSALFPPPMQVELEEVFHTMLAIKKKMYLCIRMTKDGKPILERDQLKIRGVVPARRDNCLYQRNSFLDIAWDVLLKKSMQETYDNIINICLRLVRREIPWQDLVVIKGLGAQYKNKSYCMKVFSDELCKIGKPAAPGDRLEYLIVKSYGVKDKQLLGYKMRLPSTYLERLESDTPEVIDYEYYLEKSMMNCIQKQLFQIGYKQELNQLKTKYLDIDQTKLFNDLRKQGYTVVVEQALAKFNGDKGKAIDFLLTTDLKKVVNPLVTYYIKKRGRISTRMDGEPIKMMIKLIQQKQKCMDVIKTLIPLEEVPLKRPAKLQIVTPTLGMSQQQVADNWIKSKVEQIN